MNEEFDSSNILEWLNKQPNEILDKVPFGLVKMSKNGTVVFYNKAEELITGVKSENTIGKHFFTQVAPCTNNFLVAEKYNKIALDEQVQYIFTYVTQPISVQLRLLKGAGEYQYMLVKKI
jgi:photoactive yellow protein